MNFLGCDGSWTVGASGEAICNGTPVSYTAEQLSGVTQSPLAIEDVNQLMDGTLYLFATVFGFLALKKVL